MATRQPPAIPLRPKQSAAELKRAIGKLEKKISDLDQFDPSKVTKRFGIPEVKTLEIGIDEALSAAFGHGTVEYIRYESAITLDHGGVQWDGENDSAYLGRKFLADGKAAALALLKQAVQTLREEVADLEPEDQHRQGTALPQEGNKQIARSKDIFVVHGREEASKEMVARFLEKIGFKAIILHERPNKGRPLITKLREEATDAGFAIIIATPDDIGALASEIATKPEPRTRQNVVFELGFFVGALGPERVAALMKGSITKPSDYDGVAYIDFDDGGGWKQAIAKELQAAGYEVDWNRVMRG